MNNQLFNVIIVDDDELVLKSLRRVLQSESYYVWVTTSAEKALSLLSSKETAVIVSDYRMPKMTGIDVLEAAQKIAPDTTRILLTAFADVDLAQEAINHCGIYKLLLKPWNDQELKEAINSAIGLFKYSKEKSMLNTESQLLKKRNLELTEMNGFLQHRVDTGILQLKKLTAQNPKPENSLSLRATPPPPETRVKQPEQNPNVDGILLYLG